MAGVSPTVGFSSARYKDFFELEDCLKEMGNYAEKYIRNPDTTPDSKVAPQFDSNIGFPKGRKTRVMIATEEEMEAARIPKNSRDYCAHKYLELETCRVKVAPFFHKCHHERHSLEECEFDDYVLRMKEYERERRLLKRQKRKLQQQQAQAAAA
ncbi:NADH dehydrogenase [ubiquinone] 1 beta subcomplex subunit 7 [Orussus abietinus]|uniref:NADH dehydrogenase [ubiquinone] 1 beta subcomplex subunit 7 n=1 Tax=Orussus abietinus TaxID=222816 RepID=UPI000625C7D0|nr:NADH dehydrogenase [ubiquinone] 1 beta subcomplex subunit 7 [Orussus abietinus]